jgi:hypothetical protein
VESKVESDCTLLLVLIILCPLAFAKKFEIDQFLLTRRFDLAAAYHTLKTRTSPLLPVQRLSCHFGASNRSCFPGTICR